MRCCAWMTSCRVGGLSKVFSPCGMVGIVLLLCQNVGVVGN